MNESLALDKKLQSQFARKVKKVKERVKASENVETAANKETKPQRGLVYIGHIPHGFYENEMLAYFKQFGKVSNLRVCRSKATGQSKGYAFVEFANVEVAKIAAETMDNYLMFNRRLVAKYLPVEGSLKRKYKGPSWSKTNNPSKSNRLKSVEAKNKNLNEKAHIIKSKQVISTVNKNLKKLHALGINYDFQAVDDQYNLNKNIVQSSGSNVLSGNNANSVTKTKMFTQKKLSKGAINKTSTKK